MSAAVRDSLTVLSRKCVLSIAALDTTPDTQELPLSTLRTDFISLLSLIYSNTTKLSIALNPSNPTYSAALTPLKDLTNHSSALAYNASLFLPNVHGRSLSAEVHSTARSVLTALQELVHAHLSLLASSLAGKDDAAARLRSSNAKGNDIYLTKTGVVHELIAQAKADDHPQGLSRTNLIAVRKRWREHSEIVADAAATLEAEAFPSDDDDDGFDDGWDEPELGLTIPGKLSSVQVELAKTILNVVRCTSALFDDILITALTPPCALPQPLSNALLDDLLDSAPPFVAAVDDLATHVYDSPDDPAHLSEARDSFAHALTSVSGAVHSFWNGKEDPRPASEKGSRRYFFERFEQLDVAVRAVQWTTLGPEDPLLPSLLTQVRRSQQM